MLAAEAARVMPDGITRETIRRRLYAPAMASAHGSVLLDADGDERTGHRRVRWADPRGLDGPVHTNARRQVTASGASVRATFAGLAPPGIAGPFPLPGIYLWPRRMAAPITTGRSPAEAGSSSWPPSSSSPDVSGPDSCLMISSAS
jgi:hypothetical protein